MANRYWATYTNNWNTVGSWSSVTPTMFLGSRAGGLVTIPGPSGITTANISVGMTCNYRSAVAAGDATAVVTAVNSAQTFTVNVTGTITSYLFSVKTPTTVPTSADDVYFYNAGSSILNFSCIVSAGTTVNCRNLTLQRLYGHATSVISLVGSTVSGSILQMHGSLYYGNYYSLSSSLLNVRFAGTGTIYQDASNAQRITNAGFTSAAVSYTLNSNVTFGINALYYWFINSGRIFLNGYALQGTVLQIGNRATATVRPYIDFTNGGTIQCDSSPSSGGNYTPFQDPYASLYTVGNGYILVRGSSLTQPTIQIGNLTAPALGEDLCNIKLNFSSGVIDLGTTVYVKDFDLSTILGNFSARTWYVRSVIWPTASSSPASTFTGSTWVFDKPTGTVNWVAGPVPIMTINHSGTTTITTNWGSTTYFQTLNLTSGRLALAATKIATFGAINASNSTARGLDFGASSYIQGGNTTAQTKTWANATNFTVTGTFDMQTGGTGVQTIIFGTSGGAVASPNNAPEYTFTQSGDALSGYFKKINSNGFAPSTAVTTIRCNDFTGGSAFYYNATLYAWGTSPAYIKGTTTLAEIGIDGVPKTIIFTAGTTQTVTNFTVNGTLGSLATLESSVAASQFNLSKSSGAVTCDYLSLQDSNATGGATWTANNSTFGSNVTGWLGNAVAYVKSRFMAFF